MSNYEDFLGRPYVAGQSDCYGVLRDYCRITYGLELPNYARPDRFWEDPNLNLYGRFVKHGFVQVIDQPIELGDVLLMPLHTMMNSHAALVVEDNLVLHHLPGRLSTADRLYPVWANRANIVIRHPVITQFYARAAGTTHLHEVINVGILRSPEMQAKIAELLEPGSGEMRDYPVNGRGGREEEPSA